MSTVRVIKRLRGLPNLEDPYAVLDVPPRADPATLKAARNALARELHPDRCKHPDAPHYMAMVNVAYGTLEDPALRKRADLILDTQSSECSACKGVGKVWRQKGFGRKYAVPCGACASTGKSSSPPA